MCGVAILSALTLAINKLIKAARVEFVLKGRLGTIGQIWRTTAFEFSMQNGKVPFVQGLDEAFGLITDRSRENGLSISDLSSLGEPRSFSCLSSKPWQSSGQRDQVD
jgi:hypothetical protein